MSKKPGKGKKKKWSEKPGIVHSWENFDELAFHELIQEIADEVADRLDEDEQAFRNLN